MIEMVPAAMRYTFRDGQDAAECPVCGERIALYKRKDFESYTNEEYVEHVKRRHPEEVRTFGG